MTAFDRGLAGTMWDEAVDKLGGRAEQLCGLARSLRSPNGARFFD